MTLSAGSGIPSAPAWLVPRLFEVTPVRVGSTTSFLAKRYNEASVAKCEDNPNEIIVTGHGVNNLI
jgi:hypothetical protein